jgi:hypothetical protein
MWIQNFFKCLTSTRTRRRPIRRPSPASRLCLEPLEDRCLPSFLPAVSYPTALAGAVVTGAFRGADQPLDLVGANYISGTVSILLGNGNGTFQAAQSFATGNGPGSVAVGDFNGDGKLDIVTANANDVSVLLGNGNGTFQAPISVSLPGEFPPGYTGTTPSAQRPLSVAVGDFNGDGKLDLGVTSSVYAGYYFGNYGYLNVLLGNGDGSFSGPNTTPLGWGTGDSAVAANLNGDRFEDLVVTDTGHGKVIVLLGDSSGYLEGPHEFAAGYENMSLAAGDVNGDGKVDLVTANLLGNDVSVLLGDGLGSFSAPQDYATGVAPTSVVLGDFTGDGKIDIATANDGSWVDPYNLSVLRGAGDGTFSSAENFAVDSPPGGLAAGDFNGDGWLDVATTISDRISVLLNAKDWSAPQVSSFAVSGFPFSTTAGVAGSFTVTAKTASGITATDYTGTVHFSSNDAKALLPADYTFTAADAGVHTFSATLKTAGTQSITATDTVTASLTGTDGGITVKPGAANRFILSAPASVSAGVPFSLTFTVQDAYGNVVTGYTGTIHFTSTDTKATLPKNYTFTAADKGVHTFTGLVLRKKGTQKITLTDTLNSSLTGSVIVSVV